MSDNQILAAVKKIVDNGGLLSHGCVFLISPAQRVYTYCVDSSDWEKISPGIFSYSGKTFKSSGGEFFFDDKTYIGHSIPIISPGWRMIIGQPLDVAYSKIMQMEGMFILFFLGWVGLTVVVGALLSRNFVVPIRKVRYGVFRVAEGDMNYRIDLSKTDEIGELAQEVNKMSAQLKSQQESLLRAERLSALGYMATGLVHEIKNALVPLRTLTELLSISGGDQSFIAKFNDLVPKEIDRITKLSNDLLHYSKPIDGDFEVLNINEVIDETAKFLEMQARKKNVKIVKSLQPVQNIRVDRQAIIEVLTNLILNAFDAMTQEGQVTISTYEKDDKVILEIVDNGPGIPEENQKKMFVPFFTTKKEGTGMGLAITQKIMVDHNGTVDFKSKRGEGTTFYLAFPKTI